MKRLVIFCDGTWNRMSAEHPTNVLTAAQLVLPADSAGHCARITKRLRPPDWPRRPYPQYLLSAVPVDARCVRAWIPGRARDDMVGGARFVAPSPPCDTCGALSRVRTIWRAQRAPKIIHE
jgi:hypothetical protein